MESPNFHLQSVVNDEGQLTDFEGPLSLILLLLKKNRIEIRNLRISELLEQYNSFIYQMQELDLDIASEFIQMASYLLYLKTKMMLDSNRQTDELEELMSSLEKLEAKETLSSVRDAAPVLLQMFAQGSKLLGRPAEYFPASDENEFPHIKSDALLNALFSVLSRNIDTVEESAPLDRAIPQRVLYSVREKSKGLLQRLKKGRVFLNALFTECQSKSELVATFLSVLELCSMGCLSVSEENGDFGIDYIGENEDIIDRITE